VNGPGVPAEVVDAVCAHMNGDHPEDCLLIVRGLGGLPDAVSARMSGLDETSAIFDARLDDATTVRTHVPFQAPVTERVQIRQEVVRMYQDACAALGVTTPRAEEH
jgi:hypothetical protein